MQSVPNIGKHPADFFQPLEKQSLGFADACIRFTQLEVFLEERIQNGQLAHRLSHAAG